MSNNKLKKFKEQMENELIANAHKGDWEEFKNLQEINAEIEYHMFKIKTAERWMKYHFSENAAKLRIKVHIAECANLLLMLGNSYNLYD